MLKMSRRTTASSHQTSIRSPRKSEWLLSALTHHYDPDPGVENEIVVLATGIDQYLQEVFHHLAYYNGDDLISGEDFRVLCAVLGIPISAEGEELKVDGEEARDICSGLPRELHFKEFHRRLCGYFNIRVRNRTAGTRLPVTEETEHIEREIRLRWPRVRRRKCVSFDLSKNIHPEKRAMCRPGSLVKPDSLNSFAQLGAETGSGPQWVTPQHLEAENASLRELVEDLRSALQGSDARCLALEVALRRQGGSPLTKSVGETGGDARLGGDTRLARQPGREWTHARGVTHLLRELNLIRASRDGQLEEAMKFNQRLEAELGAAYQEGRQLEEALIRLQRENRQIKQRAEEARTALAGGLDLVREIQGQASTVPSLQDRIRELEEQLQGLRNGCTCRTEPKPELEQETLTNPPSMTIGSPLQLCSTGSDESYIREEGLQRAVEGRAASDEEEEDRESKKEGQCCLVEMKKLINRLPNCGKGCPKMAARHLLISHGCLNDMDPSGSGLLAEYRGQSCGTPSRLEEKESEQEKMLSLLGKDMQLKQEEVEMLRMEVQMVETERVRLSLLEEKLTDTLTLLLQLRTKNISRRALGKIIVDTLDVCCKNGHGPSEGLQVLEALSLQLLSCELLGEEGGARAGTGTYRNSANPLLISC